MRTIGVVTVARSDYGIYRPILHAIQDHPSLRLRLIVGGAHLEPKFGMTVQVIEDDGFEIAARVAMLHPSDSPEGIARSMGIGTIGFAEAYASVRPDLLLVLGDRFEMFSAVAAALPFAIPTAHIHGGESTEALIDEAIRHSITKMSHLHFVSTHVYRRRVIQMGEEPWRVMVSGAPGLDNLRSFVPTTRNVLSSRIGVDLAIPTLLVAFHPVTLEAGDIDAHLDQLFASLDLTGLQTIFTYPNADTHGRHVIDRIEEYASRTPHAKILGNLGTETYFSLMSHVRAMVGNSSSGIIEAASLLLPVVNIGNRQRGRVHERNVIDVGYGADEIAAAVRRVATPEFRASLAGLSNPYGTGNASSMIVQTIASTPLDERLMLKRFHDVHGGSACE